MTPADGLRTPLTFTAGDPGDPVAGTLLRRYFAELAARFPEGFDATAHAAPDDELRPPGGLLLIARAGEAAVACGGLRTLEAGVAEVKHMWVDPDWRGRGVARALLAELEEGAASMGFGMARLDTSVHLPEAVALYRSAGWAETPPYNDNPHAGHWFAKRLGARPSSPPS